jgi:pimeloyl-[acyl-carrier protein] methyl ester esterase
LPTLSQSIIDQLGDKKPFYVLGWSLGGILALDLALRFQHQVLGVVLLASNPCFVATQTWQGMPLTMFNEFCEQLRLHPLPTLQRFLALQFQNIPNGRQLLKNTKQSMLQSQLPLSALEHGLHLLKENDYRFALAQLTCPVKAMMSDNDPLIPIAVSGQLKQLQPSIDISIFSDAGHVPFISHTQPCLAAIRAFIDDRK